MNLAETERELLCQLLLELGPDAPTLCEGWQTSDLAAHLWMRENDPLGAPGLVIQPLAEMTERRMAQVTERFDWPELVERIRRGPAALSLFSLPGLDQAANSIEFFVHHEDVRRAGEATRPPRVLPEAAQDWLWRRVSLMARVIYRRSPVGVVLERAGTEDSARGMPGSPIVTLRGEPAELLLFSYGRRDAADIEVIGADDAIAHVVSMSLGI